MKQSRKISTLILWIARIWGGLILAFILFMVIAHIIESITGEAPKGEGFRNVWEIIAFGCFFVIVLGLAIAYKWEGLGGLIACLGLVIMFTALQISAPDVKMSLLDFVKQASIFIFFIFPPGFLYLLYWYTSKRKSKTLN
ncbi:hypothetical protein RXV94_10475 [Yeosuana sp. MJ-SS3]|jgi:hypothetical protein|uniref:DUF7670 domain-containing protein n=1 Tax=Gilvirhabdus luticola TaxID=3079858 RepID=A0ABU3U842_9FLAO|nr:hypothetical protein [Yeosuana sp. MJ-SS3]MDU8886585.1 hypothetical protein [Yeosuana sp. MJ-SS3]